MYLRFFTKSSPSETWWNTQYVLWVLCYYLFSLSDLVLGHYTVDVYWTVDTERGKRKNLLYFLPLGLLVTSSMLLLTSLLFSESQEEFVLLLICFLSLVFLLMMLILRHSKLYVDLPKYCPYELIETLKIWKTSNFKWTD